MPGRRAAACDAATWQKLFAEISPEALAKVWQKLPGSPPDFDDIKEGYESQAAELNLFPARAAVPGACLC